MVPEDTKCCTMMLDEGMRALLHARKVKKKARDHRNMAVYFWRISCFELLMVLGINGIGTMFPLFKNFSSQYQMLICLACLQALQAAVQRIHTLVSTLEEKLEALEKKK